MVRKQTASLKMNQRLEPDTLPMKISRWQISIWKDVQYQVSLENYKLKQQRDTSIHSLEWEKSKTLTALAYWQGCGTTGTLILCWQEWNQCHFDTIWQFFTKLSYSYHAVQQSHSLIPTQMNWKLMSTLNLHTGVYSSFIHNCQNLEATHISLWMDK